LKLTLLGFTSLIEELGISGIDYQEKWIQYIDLFKILMKNTKIVQKWLEGGKQLQNIVNLLIILRLVYSIQTI